MVVRDTLTMIHDYIYGIDSVVLAVGSLVVGYVFCYLRIVQQTEKSILQRILGTIFHWIKRIPPVRRRLDAEVRTVYAELRNSIHGEELDRTFLDVLPRAGHAPVHLIDMTRRYARASALNAVGDYDDRPNYLEGRVSGAAFSNENDEEEKKVYREVFEHFAFSNPLWPKLYPGVRKMESEVVRMCCEMMNGNEQTCGTMSSGGTMSILLACLAHRNRALARGVLFPEMIVPSSAHAAFFKAGEVFRIKVVKIPLHPDSFTVDIAAMEHAITPRTCMLVGSTPNFPFGTVDDIIGIGEIGVRHDVPVHVDACLGGFLLPFMKDAPPFDFQVPGVCSISADPHKYGLTPKGASVILYRNADYRKYQYFADADWQGGIYASATLEGSRAGLNIALCWAAMLYHGKQKYAENARKIQQTTQLIRDEIARMPELRLQGASDTCIVSWTSDTLNIHHFHHLMGQKGWQLSALQFPNGVHLMVTMNHCQYGVVDDFIRDIRETIKWCKQFPEEELTGSAALYGMTQRIPDRSLVQEFAHCYLDACYSMPPDLPSSIPYQ